MKAYLCGMIPNREAIVVDAGNTQIKVAVFQDGELTSFNVFSQDRLWELKQFLLGKNRLPAIIASVRSVRETNWLRQLLPGSQLFSYEMVKNLKIAYETPETLGADRLCNAIAAFGQFGGPVLAVDFGTCVKYDLTTSDGTYLGGAISPGLSMRFKAMNTFTAKLPLINNYQTTGMVGMNTIDAMKSGVLNGMFQEVNGMICGYRELFPGLKVVVTGGDARYFDFGQISDIFADEFLTLKGLQLTLAAI